MTVSTSIALTLYDLEHIAKGLGKHTRSDTGYVCLCPVHDDRTPSLSLSIGEKGTLLVYCFAGCSFEEIIKAIKNQNLLPNITYPPQTFKKKERGRGNEDPEEYKVPPPPPVTLVKKPLKESCTPLTPVPEDAPIFSPHTCDWFNKKFNCQPSALYPYRNAEGQLLGYMVRWDNVQQKDGTTKKEARPYVYAQNSTGYKMWASMGLPGKLPLYNLQDIAKRPNDPILIVEGEKTVEAAKDMFPDYVVTTTMFGAQSPKQTDWSVLKDRNVLICSDFDEAGQKYGDAVYALCKEAGVKSLHYLPIQTIAKNLLGLPDIEKGYDLADAKQDGLDKILDNQNSRELIEPLIVSCLTKTDRPKECYDSDDFLRLEINQRQMILGPIIPEKGLVMLYAPRGIGKTHIALEIAYTVASGKSMFDKRWIAQKPMKVLYVDGEMPAVALQERLTKIILKNQAAYNPKFLKIISADLLENSLPDLGGTNGQALIERNLKDIDLLIFDNLSSLCRSGRENESESWIPMQEFLLSLRKRGVAVLLIHHANKNGGQRGTSKKEDILDTVISLKRPSDYEPEQGARFEVHFEKTRGFFGEDAKPFEVKLVSNSEWITKGLEDCLLDKVLECHKLGMTQREIVQELGLSKGTVSRKILEAKKDGLIT